MSTVMHFSDIQPFIRFVQYIAIPWSFHPSGVVAYDHRLFYVVKGNGTIDIDGTRYSAVTGSVFIHQSGVPYRFLIPSGEELHVISVNFDYTQKNSTAVQYLPLENPGKFDASKLLEKITFSDAPTLNKPVYLENMQEIRHYLDQMIYEFTTRQHFYDRQMGCWFTIILNLIIRNCSFRQSDKSELRSHIQILEYIRNHYQEDLCNHKLGSMFNYHPNYINQLIKRQTGLSLHQYVLTMRINKALELIQTTNLSIEEISKMTGFKNTSYFSQFFKKCTGFTPKSFRITE